jgi:hypothetical protein
MVAVDLRDALERDGFALLPGIFAPDRVSWILAELEAALAEQTAEQGAIRNESGAMTGARNVLELWPPAAKVWREPPLVAALTEALGDGFGLVRVLYFDKPPGQTWALPWHKDLTIAVRDNTLASQRFRKPTRKAGVPHIEAPEEVLALMLTARVHLDAVTETNGPLKIIPGSHKDGKELRLGPMTPAIIFAGAGDVLLMRPLVTHASGRSHPATTQHRRILHLEFAASAALPDGFAWEHFVAGNERSVG